MTVNAERFTPWRPGKLAPHFFGRDYPSHQGVSVAVFTSIIEEAVAGQRQHMTLEQVMRMYALESAIEVTDYYLEMMTHD